MNLNKGLSGNIDQAYEHIIRSNINNDYRRPLHNRKSPLNNNYLRSNYYYSFNKPPEATPYVGEGYYQNIRPKYMKKFDSENIDLEENININDYLSKIQNRKKINERSPFNYKIQQNNNYSNYNKNFISNNNIKFKNNILKNYESDDFDDNNYHYQYSEDDINKMNNNWKKKILKINEQKANNEYFNRNRDNFSNYSNNSYQNRNNLYDDKSSVNSQSDYSNNNQILSQSVNVNINQPKKFNNYINNHNKNINLSNDINQKYLQDYNSSNYDFSDNNSIKNRTYENYYNKHDNFNNYSNNDSSSSNFYDESYEKNKTNINFTNKLKSKFSDVSKFFNSYKSVKSVSISSQDMNTSSEYYRDDDTYNSVQYKRPMKNDERHYHQNLTIKINKKDEKNLKKNEKVNNSSRPRKQPQYVDNTPEGCNVSTNTDINIREKKISNFNLYPKENKLNNYNLSYNSDYSNISDKNCNNISSSTMFIPQKTQKQFKNNNFSNNNLFNKNKESLLQNSMQIKINNNNNVYVPQRDILNNNRKFKGRSPQNLMNYNDKFNKLYNNNSFSNNTNKTPIKSIFSRLAINKNNNPNNFDNFQNRKEDNFYGNKPIFNQDKKIKEITVNLSPRKNFFNLSNSNGNLNNRINNITPNYNYNFYDNNINNINKVNNIYRNDLDDKFSFNNINIKPKAKIESCIITFDKNKNNINNKKIKLSSSLDGLKLYRTKKYIRKKIPIGANSNTFNNNINFNETPGMNMNISKTKSNIFRNKFIYNKNKSAKKLYQKPEKRKKSSSIGKNLLDESDKNEEGVQNFNAPSPDYGKRGKNYDENLISDSYNHSPLLVSGNFKVINNEKKELSNPYSPKYDEFSFKTKLNTDVNDVNYDTSKPIKVKIINSNETNNISNTDKNNAKIKSIYMKKTKTNSKLNNANINNINNFSLFTSQRVQTFSNVDELIPDENNSNKNIINENNIIHHSKKSSEVTPFGISDIPKKEKPKPKLIIKSFSSKKNEPKVKPELYHSFFRKYYDIYLKYPKIDLMYISKNVIKPPKKPLLSISYISKKKFKYIYKIPKSSYEYYSKKVVPNPLILPKINKSYISKIFIKNKEYIENRLNNIGNDNLLNNNEIKMPDDKNKNININNQNKPIKKRIILIRKTKKANKKFYDNLHNNNLSENKPNNNTYEINDNYENDKNDNRAAALPIYHVEEDKSPFQKEELIFPSDTKDENISPFTREEVTIISDNNEDLNKNININNTINAMSNYSSKENTKLINKDTGAKNDKIYIKKKKILQNIMRKEKVLTEERRFDNENSFGSSENDLSFNLNINKIKDESKDNSKLFKYYNNNKSIDTSTIKSQSNNTSINEGMNKTSSSFYNIMKASALNFSINNNLNNSNNDDLSMISNNTMNIELHNTKKNIFKIRTMVRGVKKKSKHDFLKNYKYNKNLNISELLKKHIKTKKDIDKEKKVNSIIKEDLENFVLFYKDKNNDNKKIKYDWSMVEQLMIKIKLDIVDIIIGYLKACDDVVNSKKCVQVVNEYIKNIIYHYKYNYLTNKNFSSIHNRILKLYLSVKDIKIYDSIKFEIYGKLLYVLINNELFFLNDLNILKKADEQTKTNIKKILNNTGNNILITKFIN